jgi:hypothetical protein
MNFARKEGVMKTEEKSLRATVVLNVGKVPNGGNVDWLEPNVRDGTPTMGSSK